MARLKRVTPVIGMQVMDMRGNRYEVIRIDEKTDTITERNLETGVEFDVPTAILGFYMTWLPESVDN